MSLIEYAADSGQAVDDAAPTDPTPAPVFQVLQVAAIVSSPTNPRKSFDQAKLQELADSIKAAGLHQPVLVRPLPGSRVAETSGERVRPTHELIAGERRWRACKLAGLASIPALVKPMTDAEVIEVQIVENLQRDDLAPLEEADGYQALIAATGIAKEDIGARIGRSRTYVYGRLKLLDLCPEAAAALRAGTIDASRALVIARIPDTQLQLKALEEASRKDWQGTPTSYRAFLNWAQSNVMLKLSEARFKITDANLVPAAGSCRACPKRTGANPDLFSDVNGADVCTDPKCYSEKQEAHDAAVIRQAQENGSEVILGKQAKKLWGYEQSDIDGFIRLDKPDYRVDGKKPLSKVLGKDLPAPTLIAHPRTGELVAVLPTDTVNERLKELQLITSQQAAADKRADKAQAARALQEKFERTWRKLAVAKVYAAGSTQPIEGLNVDVQKLLAMRMVPALRQDERAIYGELFGIGKVAQADGIRDHIRAADVDTIDLVCMVLLALRDTNHIIDYHGKATETPHLDAIAAQLEVDLQAVRAEAKEAIKPKAKKAAPAKASKADSTAVKYRGPNGETWTGRGQQPAWVKALLRSGGTLEALEVKDQADDKPAEGSLAVGTAVRFKEGLKGPGGKIRKCSGRVGTIEKRIQRGVYSVRFSVKLGDIAIGDAAELEVVTTSEDAQAGIAKALQALDPVPAWPMPNKKKAAVAA